MGIHPSAIVDPSAEIHPEAEIGPYCRVGAGCKLAENNVLMQGAILGPNTEAGPGNVFHYHSLVGGDPQYLGFDPDTASGTLIGQGNHFREFSQVHRGLKDGGHTVLGNRNFIMATAHIAHDCVFGDDNVLANYSGLAGHVVVGNRCFISGHVGVHQFCRIGDLAMIGGSGKVPKDVPPFMILKHYGLIVGVNVVGLRRAGVGTEARLALKDAYREIFRSGKSLTSALETLRLEWQGRTMPPELQQLISFCATRSKRGLSHGPRLAAAANDAGDQDMEEGDDHTF